MVILGKGKVADKPYTMPYHAGQVYSIEELCYYIYNHIYTINEDFFQPALPVWLTEELDMSVLSVKLKYMIEEKHGMKDLVVAVLCSCDYYKEEEIRQIVDILDEITNLPIYKKKKIKADNYLRAGCYARSLHEYRKLLHGSFAINFTPEEYGDILHNQGIAHFYISSKRLMCEITKAIRCNTICGFCLCLGKRRSLRQRRSRLTFLKRKERKSGDVIRRRWRIFACRKNEKTILQNTRPACDRHLCTDKEVATWDG